MPQIIHDDILNMISALKQMNPWPKRWKKGPKIQAQSSSTNDDGLSTQEAENMDNWNHTFPNSQTWKQKRLQMKTAIHIQSGLKGLQVREFYQTLTNLLSWFVNIDSEERLDVSQLRNSPYCMLFHKENKVLNS